METTSTFPFARNPETRPLSENVQIVMGLYFCYRLLPSMGIIYLRCPRAKKYADLTNY